MKKLGLMAMVLTVALLAGLPPCAHAWGKHATTMASFKGKVKKNKAPFGGINLAPKKQKKVKGYYRSTLTGKRVY